MKLMYKTPKEALEIINSEEICFDGSRVRALKVENECGHVMTTGSRIIDKTQQLNNTSTSDCPQPTSFEICFDGSRVRALKVE